MLGVGGSAPLGKGVQCIKYTHMERAGKGGGIGPVLPSSLRGLGLGVSTALAQNGRIEDFPHGCVTALRVVVGPGSLSSRK